jgi:HD superfamily phosphohydrolase YqeK
MRFRTRAFLLCFVPFALLLTISFFMIQNLVQATVREGLRAGLRANHLAVARARSKNELQNSRFLRVVGENAGLKAGMQLILFEPDSMAARRTVEDQLRELCGQMGFDFLMVSAWDRTPLAAVMRSGDQLVPVDTAGVDNHLVNHPAGLLAMQGRAFQIASVPIDLAGENIGSLAVGGYFDFSDFTTPAVLMQGAKVVQSGVPNASIPEIEAALEACQGKGECDIRLRGVNYMSLPMEMVTPGGGYLLRSLQDVDSATGPLHTVLRNVFVSVAILSLVVALLCSVFIAGGIGEPLAAVVGQLREAERTGLLAEFSTSPSAVHEIRELTDSFNRAAVSIRAGREGLENAYLEFVGSLANALDARDPYTAGHSRRVSDLSCAIAGAVGLGPAEIQRIRIGALLHDIGKIGISDAVLQKPGKLTKEEFAIVRQHPVIGRRILESVQGFTDYLPAVELHHENWDGSGYPNGHHAEETPIEARIIHVADAYDAMTTDRPYRNGMSPEQAIEILSAYGGSQFDGAIVQALIEMKVASGMLTGSSQ